MQQVYIATGFFYLWDPTNWLLLWHIVFSLILFLVSSLPIHTHIPTHTDIHSLIYSQNWTAGESATSTANETHPNKINQSGHSLPYASLLHLVNVGCFHHISSNNAVTHPFVNSHFQDIKVHFLALHMIIYRNSSLLIACLFRCWKAHSKLIFKAKQPHS